MKKLFPTMEVGSLRKAPFLTRDRERAAVAAERWGSLLNVADYQKLVNGIMDGSVGEREVLDWASIYGLRFFESAGLDIIYDGEAKRPEMYEHPLKYVDGFSFRGLVRVWDNEYYLKAAVVARPRLREPYHIDEFLFNKRHATRPLKVPITGPYTLADWSLDEYYIKIYAGGDPLEARRRAKHDMVMELAKEVIRPTVKNLVEHGAEHIQLDEPAAATKPSEVALVVEAVNEVLKGLNAEATVHICYTDYSALLPDILEMKVSNLSISCSNADTTQLGLDSDSRRGFKVLELFHEYDAGFRVAPGVVDVHTDFIESPELVRDRLIYSAKLMSDPAKIIACNDCGLRTRAWDVAYKKQLSLVRGAELARSAYS
jgi:5-methyltetrahydropteroyltriglutamate--homocysteine methyltransferase